MPKVDRRFLNLLLGFGGGTVDGTVGELEEGGVVARGGASSRSEVVTLLLIIPLRLLLVGARHLTTTA